MSDKTSGAITIRLPFTPPYNWSKLIQFLAARTIPGVEVVGPENSYYRRSVQFGEETGVIEVRAPQLENYLAVSLYNLNENRVQLVAERLTRLFDLNCNPAKISAHFQNDPYLSSISSTFEGLRVPGAWDGFELTVRAILGQQISVQAARTLAGRIVQAYGTPLAVSLPAEPTLNRIFPAPQILADANLSNLGITGARAKAINGLAEVFAQKPHLLDSFQNLEEAVATLQTLPGVGPWTAQYIAMRALHEPNAFPFADLGLLKAFTYLAQLEKPATPKQLAQAAQNWQPWRAYAALLLWNTPLPSPVKN